jgi:hypothetical protein
MDLNYIGLVLRILLNIVNVYFKFLKDIVNLGYKVSCYYISTRTNPLEHVKIK